MTFRHPEIGLALIILVIVFIIVRLIFKQGRRYLVVGSLEEKKPLKNSRISLLGIFTYFVATIAIGLLIFVSMKPEIAEKQIDDQKGIDIMMVVDISGSMSVRDVLPTRIEAAQQVIRNFVSKLSSDRVGMVVFAGTPVTLSPLTTDYALFNDYLDLLSPSKVSRLTSTGGTAVGDALLLSTNKFQVNDRQKVIVLLTDGESNLGITPTKAATEAKRLGIRVYTVFISSYDDSKAQSTLQEVSDMTNAKSYSAQKKSDLDSIFNDINDLERASIKVQSSYIYRDVSYPYILAALAAWMLLIPLIIARKL